jgi:hypothetical protein
VARRHLQDGTRCDGSAGPLPNWPQFTTQSGCKTGGNWIACPNLVFYKDGLPVMKTGKVVRAMALPFPCCSMPMCSLFLRLCFPQITSCADVCEGFCPNFLDTIGGISSICDYTTT